MNESDSIASLMLHPDDRIAMMGGRMFWRSIFDRSLFQMMENDLRRIGKMACLNARCQMPDALVSPDPKICPSPSRRLKP